MSSTGTPSCWRWMMSVFANTAQRPERRGTLVERATRSEYSSSGRPRRIIWSSKKEPVPAAQLSFTANCGTRSSSPVT